MPLGVNALLRLKYVVDSGKRTGRFLITLFVKSSLNSNGALTFSRSMSYKLPIPKKLATEVPENHTGNVDS